MRKYLGLILVLLVAGGLYTCRDARAAGLVFYDSFEAGTGQWSTDDWHDRCVMVNTPTDGRNAAYSGSQMLRCNWDGVVPWYDSSGYETLKLRAGNLYTDELFMRFRLRLDQNHEKSTVDINGGSAAPVKILRFHEVNDAGNELIMNADSAAGLGTGAYINGWSSPGYYGNAVGDNTGKYDQGWRMVEYYINMATNTIKVWNDDQLVLTTTQSFGGDRWGELYLTSNFGAVHDANNAIYFDAVEIYSDLLSGATGSMSAGTVGPAATDTDSDGVTDEIDNCTTKSNAGQVDSDADGYGNACDGDLNGNGFTNAQDFVLFRDQLGAASVAPVYNPADLNTNGFVNSADYVLFRALLGSAPGPSANN